MTTKNSIHNTHSTTHSRNNAHTVRKHNYNRKPAHKPTNNAQMVYGLRPLIEAIKSGKNIEKLLLQKSGGFGRARNNYSNTPNSNNSDGELLSELKQLARQANIPIQQVPIEKLQRLANGNNHQGAAGFVSLVDFAALENILPAVFENGKSPIVLVFDRITDVRNFGAMVRTAECAGVDAVVIPTQGGAPVSEDAIKTSAGALMRIPVCRSENLKSTIHYLKASGLKVVAASEKALTNYSDANLTTPLAIILGSEENGVSPELLKLVDETLRIPLQGEIESLNVSVACGITLFEALRQRASIGQHA